MPERCLPAHRRIGTSRRPLRQIKLIRAGLLPPLLALVCSGCSVIAVADAAVTVLATTVKAGASVVATTVDVAATGVRAVAGRSEDKESR
jgi:hypothetical protein